MSAVNVRSLRLKLECSLSGHVHTFNLHECKNIRANQLNRIPILKQCDILDIRFDSCSVNELHPIFSKMKGLKSFLKLEGDYVKSFRDLFHYYTAT